MDKENKIDKKDKTFLEVLKKFLSHAKSCETKRYPLQILKGCPKGGVVYIKK